MNSCPQLCDYSYWHKMPKTTQGSPWDQKKCLYIPQAQNNSGLISPKHSSPNLRTSFLRFLNLGSQIASSQNSESSRLSVSELEKVFRCVPTPQRCICAHSQTLLAHPLNYLNNIPIAYIFGLQKPISKFWCHLHLSVVPGICTF